MIEERPILYGPRNGKSLLRTYPELAKEPALKELSHDDILFAWYIGIPNSPVDHDWQDLVRYKSAAARCFEANKDKKSNYAVGNIPEEVKVAIEVFKTYSPEARMAAKKMIQTIFSKYEQMVNVDVEKDFLITKTIGKGEDKEEITEMDWTGRKSYIDSMSKISETLPSLLKQIEEGFGITEGKKNEESKYGSKAIDKFHQNKDK